MKSRWLILMFLCSMFMLGAWSFAQDRNQNQRGPTRLTDAASNSVAQALPGWEITDVDRSDESYRIRLRSLQGEATARVGTDGQLRSIDQEMRHADAPDRVRRAVEKAFPDGKVRETRKGTRIEITYTVEVERDGRRREIKVSPEGRILEVERR